MNPSEPFLIAADKAWKAGHAAEAMQLYRRVLELDADSAVALQRLAWLEQDQGRFETAGNLLQRLVELQPADARARLNLGLCLKSLGRMEQAVSAMHKAVELNPAYTAGWCNLGLLLEATGDSAGAVTALKKAVELAPESAFFAYHLAALRACPPPAICPPDYLVSLFDSYADGFDRHLFDTLSYQGPKLLDTIVAGHGPPLPWEVIDLGCGTGMTAVPFRSRARSITGVDLSPRMLHHARTRTQPDGQKIYDLLLQCDVVTVLRDRPNAFDLILAADVLIYIGDLAPLLTAAKASLRPGGVMAFTIERFAGPGDFQLASTRRYAHSTEYIARLCGQLDFAIVQMQQAVLRTGEDGKPVTGAVYLLTNR
jgi:predicted TPR repeat methyltransferase